MIDNLVSQLVRDEGRRLKPYRDTVGKLTIGVGRNLDDKGITSGESDMMLSNDIDEATVALLNACPWIANIDAVRRAVLINMTFNLGVAKLLEFKATLNFIKAGYYALASEEMLKSVWATQVGGRALRLSEQIRTGEWK